MKMCAMPCHLAVKLRFCIRKAFASMAQVIPYFNTAR